MIKLLSRNVRFLFLLGSNVLFFPLVGNCEDPRPALKFIENKNQWENNIHFSARIPGGNMSIGPGRFTYYFLDNKKLQELHELSHEGIAPDAEVDWNVRGHSIHANFIGANQNAKPLSFGRSEEYYNYYIGNDPSRWASKAYAYEGMLYPSFYKGVDLKIYSSGENLKYDFVISPNSDPSQIQIQYQGPESIYLDNGNLFLKTPLADIIEQRPIAFQWIDGKKVFVECVYILSGDKLSFSFPKSYDACYELVIDPLLIFSTYSGSTADNWGSTATPGEKGNLYSSGVTNQESGGTFPATAGAFQTTSGGLYDIGILKYDSAGQVLLYATYLGGNQSESPHSLFVNANEELIVLGTTSSINFPTSANAFDRTFNGGTNVSHVVNYANGSDIFITRLKKDGTQLLASTFLGGSSNDGLNPGGGLLTKNYGDELRGDVITDADGNILISSVTASNNFPIVNGIQPTYQLGPTDALVLKINAELSQIIWSTYLGGTGTDASHTIKLDSHGDIFVAGGTSSLNFPVTAGSYQTSLKGNADGWIASISADGTSIQHATYTGTSLFDQIYFLDLNSNGEVYVYGQTAGGGIFPKTPADVYNVPNSGQFIQKFDHNLSALKLSTVFGSGRGVPDISPTAFLVNDCNNLYMSGWGGLVNSLTGHWQNNTTGLRVSEDAYQKSTSGSDFYFMVLTDDAKEFLYGTYLGGTKSRTHVDGGTSRFDKSGIVYHAVCSGCAAFNSTGFPTSDFPTTPGVWSNRNNSRNCNNAAFKFDLSSLKAQLQTNSEKFDKPGLKVVCQPDKIVFQNFSIGGEIFQWDLGDGTKISKTDTSFIIHQYEVVGQYLVKLKAIDQGTCKSIDSTTTIVNVVKSQSKVQGDDVLCFGDPYQLKSNGGISYEWKTADGMLISSQANPTVTPADTTMYFIKIIEPNTCIHKDTVQLNVIPAIKPDFKFVREFDCVNRPSLRVIDLTDSLKSDDIIFFDYGDGTTSDLPQDVHAYDKDSIYHVKLTSSRNACPYEKVVDVPIFKIFVPNIITPGVTEGFNDVFTIQYGDKPGVTPADYGLKTSVTIYNRWGRILFKTDDYQYDWTGEELAAGIYYYDVSIQDLTSCKSWLQIVK